MTTLQEFINKVFGIVEQVNRRVMRLSKILRAES